MQASTKHLAALLALVASTWLSGCVAAAASEASGDDESLEELEAADEALGKLEPASRYNYGGMRHQDLVLRVKPGGGPLRDGFGRPLQAGPGGDPSGLTVKNGSIRGGYGVLFQGIEIRRTKNPETGKTYDLLYTWGSGSNPFHESGFIASFDIEHKGKLPLKGLPSRAEGLGRKAKRFQTDSKGKRLVWRIAPTPIDDMYFCSARPQPKTGKHRWISFRDYGTPWDDGSKNPKLPGYARIMWSWVDVVGGGIVRDVVAEGERFYPAAVRSIVTRAVTSAADCHGSTDRAPKLPDGSLDRSRIAGGKVWAKYGAVKRDGRYVYGWYAIQHTAVDLETSAKTHVRHYVKD